MRDKKSAKKSNVSVEQNPPENYAILGKRLPRVDAWSKVSGQEQYTEDVKLPNALWGKILRSPHAHAVIKNINTHEAENFPGVKAVITFKDIVPYKIGYSIHADQYALCKDKVRYVGDEVAAVAATDEKIAEKAIKLIKVEYEILPVVLDPVQAMKPGVVRLHEHQDSNISAEDNYEYGNTGKGFEEADHVFENTFETQKQCHVCMEVHGCAADWGMDDCLSVWTSTQVPHQIKRFLARATGLPNNKVSVKKVGVGGAFGSRTDLFPHDIIASFLSKKSGCPVKLILSREEEFFATVTRHPSIITIKTGIKNGKITTRYVKAILNGGAYTAQTGAVLGSLGWKGANYYRIENYKFEGYGVFTNTSVSSAYRGYGGTQLGFAIESQIDMIAEKLNLDPVEFRFQNANLPGQTSIAGNVYGSCGLKECISESTESIGWKKSKKHLIGRGLAIGFGESGWRGAYYNNSDVSAAIIKMNQDGSVHVIAGGVEIGMGYDTVIAQISAEALGVRFEHVTVHSGDTDLASYDCGMYGTRGTIMSAAAVKLAAEEIKEQLLCAGAELLGATKKDLMISNQKIRTKKNQKKTLRLSEVAEYIYDVKGLALIGKGIHDPKTNLADEKGYYPPPGSAPAYTFGAVALEVKIEPETGEFKIGKLAAASDCGKAINPTTVEGQIEGDAFHGLGMATVEPGLTYDVSGNPQNQHLVDYKILTAADMPPIHSIVVETNDPVGSFGIKGVTQVITSAVGAALANGIYDATGIRIKKLPITPEKILGALKEKNT